MPHDAYFVRDLNFKSPGLSGVRVTELYDVPVDLTLFSRAYSSLLCFTFIIRQLPNPNSTRDFRF